MKDLSVSFSISIKPTSSSHEIDIRLLCEHAEEVQYVKQQILIGVGQRLDKCLIFRNSFFCRFLLFENRSELISAIILDTETYLMIIIERNNGFRHLSQISITQSISFHPVPINEEEYIPSEDGSYIVRREIDGFPIDIFTVLIKVSSAEHPNAQSSRN